MHIDALQQAIDDNKFELVEARAVFGTASAQKYFKRYDQSYIACLARVTMTDGMLARIYIFKVIND